MTNDGCWECPVIISPDFSLVPDLIDLRRALDEIDCYLPLSEFEFDEDGTVYAVIHGQGPSSRLEDLISNTEKIKIDYDTLRSWIDEEAI